jgi:glycosyltransferase involved in cell wall biosynthesis
MIRDGENGLLADFFNVEEFADKAVRALQDPAAHRPLGRAAEKMIADQYSLEAVLPRMMTIYQHALSQKPG